MKIVIYAIAKNEEKHIDRFMDMAKEADEVIICDTGSTDNTVSRFKELGATVYSIEVNPWRFDVARNVALSKCPKDADVYVSVDIDEIFTSGWRKEIENLWDKDTKAMAYFYVFNWEDDEQTIPKITMWSSKIHNKEWIWKYPIHEVLEYTGVPGTEKIVISENFKLFHYPDLNKSRSSYLPLLEESTKNEPDNIRMSMLLGREYMFYNKFDLAIKELKRFLHISDNDETSDTLQLRSIACRYIARCYWALAKESNNKNADNILRWILRSDGEWPFCRENWIWTAQTWKMVGMDELAKASVSMGLTFNDRKTSLECEEKCWDDEFIKTLID